MATTSSGQTYHSATVILAVGRERRRLNLEHEEEWTGRGVSFCSTCDAPLHKGNVIYRGSEFTRPEPVNVRQLSKATNVETIFNTNVVTLRGDDGLSSIVLDREHDGSREVTVDGLFLEIGADPRVELATELGATLNDKREIVVDKHMRTDVHGLFAAGDVTDGSGELKQTIIAAAQGALAATSAYDFVIAYPEACRWHARALPPVEAQAA